MVDDPQPVRQLPGDPARLPDGYLGASVPRRDGRASAFQCHNCAFKRAQVGSADAQKRWRSTGIFAYLPAVNGQCRGGDAPGRAGARLAIPSVRPTVELPLTALKSSDLMSTETREERLMRRIIDLYLNDQQFADARPSEA
ncbi:MAG: hypothetical protein ACRDUB_18565, partial [Mycobacterium sp.]